MDTERERLVRRLEAAAFSAAQVMDAGEVRRIVEAGIAEAHRMAGGMSRTQQLLAEFQAKAAADRAHHAA